MSSMARVHIHAPVSMPRGASIAALAAVTVARSVASMLRALRPRPLTRFEEAQRVFDLAERLRDTDPALSGDLVAAASRHIGGPD